MPATLDPLILDLVAFVAGTPRPYDEVMDAWRTSCPRLTVWEDAIERGLVIRARGPDRALVVSATESGRDLLRARDRAA
jgi:hypothetical protein